MIQAIVLSLVGFSALLAVLFIALIWGISSVERARVPVVGHRPTKVRR